MHIHVSPYVFDMQRSVLRQPRNHIYVCTCMYMYIHIYIYMHIVCRYMRMYAGMHACIHVLLRRDECRSSYCYKVYGSSLQQFRKPYDMVVCGNTS